MITALDQKLEEVLSNKIDSIYLQSSEKEEAKEEKEVDESESVDDVGENKEEDGKPSGAPENEIESAEEGKDEKNNSSNEEDTDLDRKLSGYVKEFKDLVKAEKDPVKRELLFQAVKTARAREDKLSLELGNSKKEIANFRDFGELLQKDPKLAIKNLAKRVNLDINSLVEKATVQEGDNYDYRTPEEIARDKELEDIKQELSELKNQRQSELQSTLDQEIDSFENAKDENGDLKHPHFEKVYESLVEIMALENKKLGFPRNSAERKERLERAYKKATLLDDDLIALRDAEIVKRTEARRQRQIEEARKNKKFGGRGTNVDTVISDPNARFAKAIDSLYS